MKILVYFTFNYSLNVWLKSGTLEKELKFYNKIAEKYNIRFVFITYGDLQDEKLIQNYKYFEVLPLYKFYKYTENSLLKYIHSLLFPFKIKKMKTQFDLIKQNQLQGNWASIILKLITKKPLITRTGYDVLTFAKYENKSFIKILFYKALTYISLRKSDLYTVTSKVDKNYLEKNFKYKNPIQVRPNWVIIKNFKQKNDKKFISIGRLETQKNFEYLIELFSEYNIEIDVYGDGSLKEDLALKSKDIKANINFLGNTSNENIIDILNNNLFYISTSLFEGNPKTVLEAMSNGCVVIASKIPSHEELIDHQHNGFLIDLNQKDNLNKIENLINDKKLLRKISKNAQKSVQKSNDIGLLVDMEFEDYKSLIIN